MIYQSTNFLFTLQYNASVTISQDIQMIWLVQQPSLVTITILANKLLIQDQIIHTDFDDESGIWNPVSS